jgi:hypothetical protein
MPSARVFIVGIAVAVMGCAGCATGTPGGTEPAVSGAIEDSASPRTGGGAPERCRDGTYNRATGLCLPGGA